MIRIGFPSAPVREPIFHPLPSSAFLVPPRLRLVLLVCFFWWCGRSKTTSMVDHSSPLKSGKGVPSPWTRACCWWLSSPSRPMPCTTPRGTDGFKHGGHPQNPEIRLFPWRKWGLGQLPQKLQLFYGKPQDGLMDWCFSQSQFTIFWKDQFFGCCLLHDRVRWLFRHQARSNVHGVHVRLCHWPVYLWSLCGPGKAQTGIDLGHVAGQIGLCQTSFLLYLLNDDTLIFPLFFSLEWKPAQVVLCIAANSGRLHGCEWLWRPRILLLLVGRGAHHRRPRASDRMDVYGGHHGELVSTGEGRSWPGVIQHG